MKLRYWKSRVVSAAVATLVGAVATVAVAATPAQAASCSNDTTVTNKNTNLLVTVHYEDCSDGTWWIRQIDVSTIYDRYDSTIVLRRYQDDGSLVISWQRKLGKLGADVFYGDVSQGKTFTVNKTYNPYVYLHFKNKLNDTKYVDSPVARLPWI